MMQLLPLDTRVLPHLCVRDLQALDTACTNKYLRPRLRNLWESYQYTCFDRETLSLSELQWLRDAGIVVTGVKVYAAADDIVTFIASNFPGLKQLHGRILSRSLYTVLPQLARGCPKLEDLQLDGSVLNFYCASGVDIEQCRLCITALTEHCSQLHTLKLDHFDVSDADILLICDKCPHLRSIAISNCSRLTDASLLAIIHTYPHLQSLNIKGCQFTDDSFILLADKYHELQSLTVSGNNITSRGLTALWAANPNLIHVDISMWEKVTDEDVTSLVRHATCISNLALNRCKNISDAAVIAVAECLPHLTSLSLREDKIVTDASLVALGQHCHHLKSIDLSHIKNITSMGIAALGAGCPLLQHFSACSTNIGDADITALAHYCCNLRNVDLSMCSQISVQSVTALAENCRMLSVLNLSYCRNVNDACLYAIAQHCRNLTELNIGFTEAAAQKEAIQALKTSCLYLADKSFVF